jgi:hypothetical protein
MTRPDPASPDSGANQDDAVWLDLVARLEGTPSTPDPTDATTEGPGGDAAAPTPFSAFDPLGLAGAPPIELSARERLARPPEAAGTPGSTNVPGGDHAAEHPTASTGPRDYDADDDPLVADEFVPEEPPSLAGADPMTVLAWLGAVGGPIALLMSAMFWRSAPLTAVLGMVVVFAASVVFLIMKLPGEKDEHDDGARL